jgi:hypothetical protein
VAFSPNGHVLASADAVGLVSFRDGTPVALPPAHRPAPPEAVPPPRKRPEDGKAAPKDRGITR